MTTTNRTTPAERAIASCQHGMIRDMTEFTALLLFVGALFVWLV